MFEATDFEGRSSDDWDKFQSYPSGHAGNGMAVFGTLSFYIAGKLKAFVPSQHGARAWKVLLSLLPTFFAITVGFTRIQDFHHHHSDINAGFIFGFLSAVAAYFPLYPPLTDPNCDEPILRVPPSKIARDEEEGTHREESENEIEEEIEMEEKEKRRSERRELDPPEIESHIDPASVSMSPQHPDIV